MPLVFHQNCGDLKSRRLFDSTGRIDEINNRFETIDFR